MRFAPIIWLVREASTPLISTHHQPAQTIKAQTKQPALRLSLTYLHTPSFSPGGGKSATKRSSQRPRSNTCASKERSVWGFVRHRVTRSPELEGRETKKESVSETRVQQKSAPTPMNVHAVYHTCFVNVPAVSQHPPEFVEGQVPTRCLCKDEHCLAKIGAVLAPRHAQQCQPFRLRAKRQRGEGLWVRRKFKAGM